MFPDLDLTVHFHRRPEGRWTGLDTTVTSGPIGQGSTSTVLHDINGPVGHAQQILNAGLVRAKSWPFAYLGFTRATVTW
jgi:hypothetical protein